MIHFIYVLFILQPTFMQKRRRLRSPSPSYNLDNDDDTYEPYIPVAQRRQEKLAKLSTLGVNANKNRAKEHPEELDEQEDVLKEEEMRREMVRKERTLLMEAQEVHLKKAAEGESPVSFHHDPQFIHPLDSKKSAGEKAEEADAEILEAIKSRRKLASDMELARGITYTESLKTRCDMSISSSWA